ncbi:Replication factor C large subunit [Candidatus Gugararchaeum adminiculabundum]|nr:Replication factor C large subunit [Candidatus Gugararchaeum adminiculabundum]
MCMIWAEKHSPKDIDEVAGNQDAREEIKRWALDWQRGKVGEPLLIYGPAGNGKTSAAKAIARTMQWEIVEMNAGDLRDKESVERIVGSASTSNTLSGGRKLILIDEVDSIGRNDRGGSPAIVDLMKNAKQPVILTCNELYAKNMASIRGESRKLEFKKVNVSTIRNVLKKIAEKENREIDEQNLEAIAKNSSGDLRSAINDLQANLVGGEDARNRKRNIFETMGAILKTMDYKKARSAGMEADVDRDMLKAWTEENIPLEYEDWGDNAKAFEAMSRADVFDGRILRRQQWGLLRYSGDLSSAGVALAKKETYHKFTKYSYPSKIRTLGANKGERAKRKEICKKIGRVCSCSIKEAQKYLPLVALMGEQNLIGLKNLFGFEEEELAFLIKATEAKVQKILKGEVKEEKPKKEKKAKKSEREKGEGKEEDKKKEAEEKENADSEIEKVTKEIGVPEKEAKETKNKRGTAEQKGKEKEAKEPVKKNNATLDQFF